METRIPDTAANVRMTTDADRVITVWLDRPGKPVNTITRQMQHDLSAALDDIERDLPAGVIFTSAKARSFAAGADLFEIREMNQDQIAQYLADGQGLFERIAKLPMPTVAAINGDCLGGGYELALACTYRVASNEGSINIGLPETKLGILPAWGGTVRLPRLIGLAGALPLMLAGKTLPPGKARKIGMIDEVVRPEALLAAGKRLVLSSTARHRPPNIQRAAAAVGWTRNKILAQAEKKTRETTHGNYPAPLKLLEVIRESFDQGPQAGFDAERKALIELTDTEACRNLMRLFFLRQGAKKAIGEQLHNSSHAGSCGPGVNEVTCAAVIGGGTMGAGIAYSFARAGVRVRLLEVNVEALAAGLGRIRKTLDEDVRSGRLSALEARHALNRISPSVEWTGLKLADVIVEAVVEEMPIKRDIFARLDRLARPDAVLASNTSSLSISEMAGATRYPHRVIGMHFFNPVSKMPLVEIVRTSRSDDASLATAAALAVRIGKTPVLVADAPGFLVNRVLIPYLAEALVMAQEGTPITSIDTAMKRWGMPMGPFELLDEIGLDVGMHVLRSLSGQLQARVPAPPAGMETALQSRWLGRKSGRGFYVYDGERKTAGAPNNELIALLTTKPASENSPDDQAIQWRLVLPMVNEAARLLEEGVVRSADVIDLATVLGTGFAPFRGGMAHFADSVGAGSVVARLDEQSRKYGPRFAPAALLRRLADTHQTLGAFGEENDHGGHRGRRNHRDHMVQQS